MRATSGRQTRSVSVWRTTEHRSCPAVSSGAQTERRGLRVARRAKQHSTKGKEWLRFRTRLVAAPRSLW